MTTNQVNYGAPYCKTFYLLPKNISAIQAFPEIGGGIRMGTLIQLPQGAKVEMSGEGFDDRTTRVTWEGVSYYIFRDDIEERDFYRVNAAEAG